MVGLESQINILMVDDRPENLYALEAVLDAPRLNLTKCHSGEEALKCVLMHEYALILLDVQMPGLDGYETARIIKSRERSRDTPIIFVTAINKELEHVHSGYSVGAIDYLFKPFDPDVLKSKVDQLIKLYLNSKEIKNQSNQLLEKTKALEMANRELSRVTFELQKSEALHRLVGETSVDTIIILDEQRKIISVNPAIYHTFGFTMIEVLGNNMNILISEPNINWNESSQFSRTQHFEVMANAKDESLFPAEVHIKESRLEGNLIYVCTIRDISDRKEQIEKLRFMAFHDHLTKLPNRKMLYEMVDVMVQNQQEPFSLILLDLDHFKAVNDTLGHQIGDLLLIKLGDLINELLSSNKTMFRLGGDEFAILMPNSELAMGMETARIVLSRINQPIEIDDVTLSIGASLGIVCFPEHGKDIRTLLRRADVAMYTAKRNGNGITAYSKEQDEKDPYRLILMGDLRAAIDKNELFLVYQPKANLQTKAIEGVEALIRWKHPKLGLVAPIDFIPIAEQIGVINLITTWVLTEAIKQNKKWEQQGLDIEIAVNLSVRNLQDVELPTRLQALLDKHELSPHKITLEITESFIMSDPKHAKEVLMKIHQMGIKLSIDDFGTGYSSLAYLKNLPVNTIKIDKSFIMEMVSDGADAMIVQSIIFLAHNLGLKVVAEGVETEEVWDLLNSYNCDIAQGYYIEKPLMEHELKLWLENWQH
ncbi:EAL domain-containing protein [Paenibacillus psychroresistens]|uniref:EAL domain-containing protein n=1 Tax=Paenibacillus psychroresistens TaxID=1778678 RepID=A0A6B8RR57_9BACL|nr:EAL domain-containing protein [Paenibacillus psychroresistens]QGQ98294.1 EAL domain-containing protein [Paenibacillus psychroresistens]